MQTEAQKTDLIHKISQAFEDIVEIKQCFNCGVIEASIILEEGPDFQDFGTRHCNYCGKETDKKGNPLPYNKPSKSE